MSSGASVLLPPAPPSAQLPCRHTGPRLRQPCGLPASGQPLAQGWSLSLMAVVLTGLHSHPGAVSTSTETGSQVFFSRASRAIVSYVHWVTPRPGRLLHAQMHSWLSVPGQKGKEGRRTFFGDAGSRVHVSLHVNIPNISKCFWISLGSLSQHTSVNRVSDHPRQRGEKNSNSLDNLTHTGSFPPFLSTSGINDQKRTHGQV